MPQLLSMMRYLLELCLQRDRNPPCKAKKKKNAGSMFCPSQVRTFIGQLRRAASPYLPSRRDQLHGAALLIKKVSGVQKSAVLTVARFYHWSKHIRFSWIYNHNFKIRKKWWPRRHRPNQQRWFKEVSEG